MKKTIILGNLILLMLLSGISGYSQSPNDGTLKIGRTLGLIDAFYVDTVNLNSLTDKAIIEMLKTLDPHSVYISAKDVKDVNENLKLMGALVTRYKKNTKISKGIIHEINKYFTSANVFQTIINSNTSIEQATHMNKTVFEYDGRSPGAKDYLELAEEIEGIA